MSRQFLITLCAFGRTSVAAKTEERRRLNYEWIAGYEPRSMVTGYAAIDLDQRSIEQELASNHLDNAQVIYEQGGHVGSTAKMIVYSTSPPSTSIPTESVVTGLSPTGKVVRGKLVQPVNWTQYVKTAEILVQYQLSEVQSNYLDCQMGGLVSIQSANDNGCKLNFRLSFNLFG